MHSTYIHKDTFRTFCTEIILTPIMLSQFTSDVAMTTDNVLTAVKLIFMCDT